MQSIGRSTRSISTRSSHKSWKRPLVSDALFTDLQNGSYIAALYSIVVSIFCIAHSIFDTYCLVEAEPGATHYGYYPISFDFVYAGNAHVRSSLIAVAIISLLLSFPLLVSSVVLLVGLRREREQRLEPWLICMALFVIWRLVSFVYWSVVNDMMFSYHITIVVLWVLITIVNVFSWVVVYSNYQELSDITRLEDMAKLKMGTMSSLNMSHGSHHQSIHSMHSMPSHGGSHAGSHATTPSPHASRSTAIM